MTTASAASENTAPSEQITPSRAIRVVLVDDHALMRQGIAMILGSSPDIEVVGEAGTGEEAVTVVRDLYPDVVCMDVEMPGISGIEATRLLVEDPSVTSRVLVLTTFEREDYLIAALSAGASGFLLKNSRPEVLADGIRAVAGGEALLSPEVTRAVIQRALTPSPATIAPQVPASVATLTDREGEVLALVAKGLSNEEIAQQLFVGRATVKTHVSNVLMKLSLRDRVQAVSFAYRYGLAPLAPPPRGGGE